MTPFGRSGRRPEVHERGLVRARVERVERLRRLGRSGDEVARRVHAPVGHLLEEELVDGLAAVARAPRRERHQLVGAPRLRVPVDGAVDRALERDVDALAALGDRARVDRLHCAALALVDVAHLRAAAQRLGVGVDDVAVGGGQRPRVVRPAPDEHVAGERRRRRAAHVDVGPVEVHLQRQAGVVVADLRPAHEERRARLRRLSAGDEDVARHLRRAVGMVDRGGARGRRARGARELGCRRAEAAVDDAHHAAWVRHVGLRLVGEALGRRGRRLGIGAPRRSS